MPEFSLFRPMPGLPWYLLAIWPLIYFRIQRLMAWFQANGGPGSQMFWGLSKTGHAVLIRASDDPSGHRSGTGVASAETRSCRRNNQPVSPAQAGARACD